MTLTITYSHLSISSEDILENESVALESLAYQLRIDPWFLSKLKDTNSGELLKVYKRIIKKFEKIGSLEDLLVQVGHYCRIQAGHGECNFNGTGKFGDFLYILEDAVWKAKMIVVISQRSPERTRVFQWGSNEPVSLLYESKASFVRLFLTSLSTTCPIRPGTAKDSAASGSETGLSLVVCG